MESDGIEGKLITKNDHFALAKRRNTYTILLDIFSILNTSDVRLFDPLGCAGKFKFDLSSNISS